MLETAASNALYGATRRSLQTVPKELPAVWLYDARGSRLYEEITRLPDYYLPRREAEILRAQSPLIAARTEARILVELGSGSAPNTRFLLDALSGTLERYVPFDLSEQALRGSAERSRRRIRRSRSSRSSATSSATSGRCPGDGPRLVAFLGSTIGTSTPHSGPRSCPRSPWSSATTTRWSSASTSSRTSVGSRRPTTTRRA
jgi:L-histidine N-alpha-methyltransferase